MAIASTEPDSSRPSGIILVVVRVRDEDLVNVEKAMRRKGLVTLQKKELEISLDQVADWFTEELPDEADLKTIGYVIQSHDVENVWKDLREEFVGIACGIAPEGELRRLFPSVVVDEYLLQPVLASEYLDQLKPALLAGLQDVCDKKPEDPVNHLALYLRNAHSV